MCFPMPVDWQREWRGPFVPWKDGANLRFVRYCAPQRKKATFWRLAVQITMKDGANLHFVRYCAPQRKKATFWRLAVQITMKDGANLHFVRYCAPQRKKATFWRLAVQITMQELKEFIWCTLYLCGVSQAVLSVTGGKYWAVKLKDAFKKYQCSSSGSLSGFLTVCM